MTAGEGRRTISSILRCSWIDECSTGLVRVADGLLAGLAADARLGIAVGLDTEIDEVQEGSSLYTPTAELSGVILPEDLKRDIMVTVENFDAFRDWRKRSGLTDGGPMGKSGAGLGLVTLFHGPSGTGKTLMVNAIAHHLKKRVLLVNFPLLEGARKSIPRCILNHAAVLTPMCGSRPRPG